MAFRDWLTADGHVMPLYPWLSSAGDKFIEHGHRLLGMLSGTLTIALVLSLWIAEPRRWVRWFGVALLAGVVLQGVLGGMRVELDEHSPQGARVIALVHGCSGPLFFAACAAMVAVTSSSWRQAPTCASATPAGRRLFRLAVLTAALAYLQLVIGAVVRHSPLLLTESAGAIFQVAVYFHLLMAAAVTVHIFMLSFRCVRQGVCRRQAVALVLLIAAQVSLGLSAWFVKYGLPAWASSLVGEWQYRNTESDLVQATVLAGHGAVGALIVAVCVVVALKAGRQSGLCWSPRAAAKIHQRRALA
jgi:cytochrome c oxidase assembly protein subunit 15